MTKAQLYPLYCEGHAQARKVCDGGVLRAHEVFVNGTGLTDLERLILEFALHDATNGTPARSREEFERAVEQASDLLAKFGLRADDGPFVRPSPGSDPARFRSAA